MQRVYVMQCGLSGPVKIGISADVRSRISSLRTASAIPVNLLFVGDSEQPIERDIHRHLQAARLQGEWFNCSPEIAIQTAISFGAVPVPDGELLALSSRRTRKLPAGKKRVFSSWLPISPEERRLFQEAADKAGKKLATWARDVLVREAGR